MSMTLTGVRATFGRFIQQLTATKAGRTQQRNGLAPAHFGAVPAPKNSRSAQEPSTLDMYRGALNPSENANGDQMLKEIEAAVGKLNEAAVGERKRAEFDEFKKEHKDLAREWSGLKDGQQKFRRPQEDDPYARSRSSALYTEIQILHSRVKLAEANQNLRAAKKLNVAAGETLTAMKGEIAFQQRDAYEELAHTVGLLGQWHSELNGPEKGDHWMSQAQSLNRLVKNAHDSVALLKGTPENRSSADGNAASATQRAGVAADSTYNSVVSAYEKRPGAGKSVDLQTMRARVKFVKNLGELDRRCNLFLEKSKAFVDLKSRGRAIRQELDSLISDVWQESPSGGNKRAQAVTQQQKDQLRALEDQMKALEGALKPYFIAFDLEECLGGLIRNTFGLEGGDRNTPRQTASDRTVNSMDAPWADTLPSLGRREICDGLRDANVRLRHCEDPVAMLAAHIKSGQPNEASDAIRSWEAALNEFAVRYEGKTGDSATEAAKWIAEARSHISQLKAVASAEKLTG